MKPIELLIVEDNPADLGLIQEFMKPSRALVNILTVQDGEAALEMIKNVTPDLILLDLNLPKVDGREILRRMAMGPFRTPIIVLTASQNPNDLDWALANGASGWITKPARLRDFQLEIETRVFPWIEAISKVKNGDVSGSTSSA